ncbi:MAG: [FeFe] hydrogenase H-cluster maturation GTPase HydF [Proteocatella sp.]
MAVNELTNAPNATRLHIAIFGRRNSGKSSLINAISNQETALVSDVAGTTTDPVYRPIELNPIGPCVLIDTAGFDDEGSLGKMRVEKTEIVLNKTDMAVLVISAVQGEYEEELKWLDKLEEKKIPVLLVINKMDLLEGEGEILSRKFPVSLLELPTIEVSAKSGHNIDNLKKRLTLLAPKDFELESITSHLIKEGDHVLLVAPQDIQAPKGRLILPQVQTIRDLLDNKALVTVITTDKLKQTLELFKAPPQLIITDSQVFSEVKKLCPKESRLTSFSVLMARYKGDIDTFVSGASAIDSLSEESHVLILEACTHNPLDGDIGRIKIPNMLKKRFGENIRLTWKSGQDVPKDMDPYDLVIHCGGCMLNRQHVLSRIESCKKHDTPVTNYGVFIAHMTGILKDVVY